MSTKVVPAYHAGSWYPIGQELKEMLDESFSNANVSQDKKGIVKAIIAPHAGYVYSVATASYAYKAIDPSNFDRVVILGPSHRIYVKKCTIAAADGCETPYGTVPIDRKAADELLQKYPDSFQVLSIDQSAKEHSLEMQLPLLKYVFGDKPFSVIPIMIGDLKEAQHKQVVEALTPIISDPKTLLVISSDFCHWGNNFDYFYLPKEIEKSEPVYKRIERLDKMAWEYVKDHDPKGFTKYISETENTICGYVPITMAMEILVNYDAEFPHYSQSSHAKSKHDSSVSYSAGILRI
ncbi:hypothetical protein TVAG_013700 [Trichomonas vaginalis G3]|uniref:MEMO1 family protein n=1 Tax=Trichomonas vaginalis (strain ATCC PRA-98 / G3) TaxID=412133 RepID=A2DDC6_TRIV3|nr:regulation of microtubule-based process [Trichomonas vaginalis G3]EAY21605.1 hypothetical protein TVAG_013700 [Trichomonas vaginalis G3]KAI5489719.1 regulation of microtubule-based process [Trichomonas vaginalis G3]|eukprot:XP_001582591.1 hypothetical protein [Trichomonas vaginalis G3]